MVEPTTTSFFWFDLIFHHDWICGLAVAFYLFFGVSYRASKNNPQKEVSQERIRELRPNAKNVIRLCPPFPLRCAIISHLFIPVWQIRQCSRMGASTTMATARRAMKSTMMATAQRAMTTMTMVMARRDTTMSTMATDVNNNDDNKGNNASLTTSNEGDNCNSDNGKDPCASTATTPAHQRWQQHSPV